MKFWFFQGSLSLLSAAIALELMFIVIARAFRRNVVRLHGQCSKVLCLVYEYVAGGTWANSLLNVGRSLKLSLVHDLCPN